jgi:RNA-binding protein
MNLTGKEKKYLRGLAHGLEPFVFIGKNGITENLITAVNDAIEVHELIKVKFQDFKEEKKDLSIMLAKETKTKLCGLVGNVAILYRQNEKEEKRKIFFD